MKSLLELEGYHIGPYDDIQWAIWRTKLVKGRTGPREYNHFYGYYPNPSKAVAALARLVADNGATALSEWLDLYSEWLDLYTETTDRIMEASK